MDKLAIRTNNVPREVLSIWDLTDKEKAEFDYLTDDQQIERSFVRYKGWVYDLGDVMSVSGAHLPCGHPFERWHGYVGDSFFSGVVFKWCGPDFERVICGTYYA